MSPFRDAPDVCVYATTSPVTAASHTDSGVLFRRLVLVPLWTVGSEDTDD